jgi:predicted lipoprotein with Yx(FWY)xxD motif
MGHSAHALIRIGLSLTLSAAILLPIGRSSEVARAQEEPTVQLAPDGGAGVILLDPAGWNLYTWLGDRPGTSNCYADCATAWPPYIVDFEPTPPIGLPGNLVLIGREDGTAQVSIDGWPLYYYAGDGRPGDAKGDEVVSFNFAWQVAAYPPRTTTTGQTPGVPIPIPDGPSPSFTAPPPVQGIPQPTLIPASPFRDVQPRATQPAAPPLGQQVIPLGPIVVPGNYAQTTQITVPPGALVSVTWLEAPGATAFRIYQGPTSTGLTVGQTVNQPPGSKITNGTIGPLNPGGTYFIQVRGVDTASIESIVPSAAGIIVR